MCQSEEGRKALQERRSAYTKVESHQTARCSQRTANISAWLAWVLGWGAGEITKMKLENGLIPKFEFHIAGNV